jgi:phosphoglycerate kinase
MGKKTVRDIDVSGKRVFVRVDYNVPMDEESGTILDDSRIRATLPTIEYLRERGAKVILGSHLGRPKGTPDRSLSLRPVARTLGELIEAPVRMTECCIGADVQRAAHSLEAGEVLLLENLRFHEQEEANDPEYAKALASLVEVYVNDAFGTAHRGHASTEGIAKYVPAVSGFLMEKEIEFLSKAAINPEHPYAAIIGGAKVSSKMAVMGHLMEKVDKLLIGGGMANTFLKAEGFHVGESLVEDDYLGQARDIMQRAEGKGVRLLLPTDVIVARRFEAESPAKRVSVKDVPDGWRILDVGETTIDVFAHALKGCKTVVWNGPMGVIEMAPFSHGSHRLAAVVANLEDATTIIGGGETAAVVEQTGLQGRFSHVSTGGGASLEFLEGKELPGVAALLDAD